MVNFSRAPKEARLKDAEKFLKSLLTTARFVFGVDLDGVVADFYKGLKPIAAEWMGVDAATLTDNVTFGLPEWGLFYQKVPVPNMGTEIL